MTRKRVGEGLLEAFSETCEVCHGRGVILHTEPVDKSGGNTADDDRPQGKQTRRKRGGRATAADDPVVESLDAVPVEKRKAASAAIAAIHRAASGEGDYEDGLADLASGLVNAAAGAEPPAADAEPVPEGPDRSTPERAREAAEQALESVAVTEAGPAPEPQPNPEPEHEADSAPEAIAEPGTETQPYEPAVNGAAEPVLTAPRRRRRSASRPAGPPVGV
jgi:ribonuclease E